MVANDHGHIVATEPAIDGTPVTKWVADMTDRVLCFVEDVFAHGIQRNLGAGITLEEIARAERRPEMPLRFQFALSGDS